MSNVRALMLHRTLLSLVLCCLAPAGNAQSATSWDFASRHKSACSLGNMIEMNQCLEKAYAETDLQMNKVYQELQRGLLQPAPLRKAQIAWLRYRDLQCEFQVPKEWEGSSVPYSRNACRIDLTEKRLFDLKQIVPCNGCVEFKPEYYGPK
jgi:uncharacterized protein YecT (DUF1311 family)